MDKKLRQITDSIHDTIYLSQLESEFISTPYFYRLHDIYQSSTVYMTYPSNRTKRYEHSLGTMEVASSMLYAAVSNADNETRNELFRALKNYFKEILDLAILQTDEQTAPYFTKCRDQIGTLFDQDNVDILENSVRNEIRCALEEGCFSDSALEHFQYYPMGINESKDLQNIENVFLYRCLLQAVRIVALFHDVGHPPYSHIIEDVLIELYDKYSNAEGKSEWQKKQLAQFKKCLEPYASKKSKRFSNSKTLYSSTVLNEAALHERVGLNLLHSAINDVIPEVINKTIYSDKKLCCKIATAIYHIMIVEFTIAILVEKDIFFKSFHKIVDGIVDADRLDYIMRDSLNSGVDWGKIPYKRVVNSAKLIYIKENANGEIEEKDRPFVIAYPKRVVDDIEDLLLVRYKIFARINFHHRCMKTAVALQTAVMMLAEDYLNSSMEDQCINSDINILWGALGSEIGDRKGRVIQWNDSWLISVLHKSLVKLNVKNGKSPKMKILKENLEEILLNKKRYYALFKKGNDSKSFVDKIFDYAQLTEEKLNALKLKEYQKYGNNEQIEISMVDVLKSAKFDAIDSINRVIQLQKAKSGDIEALYRPLPLLNKAVEENIDEVLRRFKDTKEIVDFKILTNGGKQKTGIPRHTDIFDEIYLYDGNKSLIFDDTVTLREQIGAIEKQVLWLYIYYVPNLDCKDVKELEENLINNMAESIGLELKYRYEELFGSGM